MPSPGPNHATGVESFEDSNFVFGSVQRIDLANTPIGGEAALACNFARRDRADASIVPLGGGPSAKIKHVFFILHENKTFDSMLGADASRFGPFASTRFAARGGAAADDPQYTGVDPNTRILAGAFATAVNYYSDSEESDAGHQYCASGTATDYTEKTLLVKDGRGLLVNKNFEPEDYPAGGYIFNNAARHGVSFKDYGDLVRIAGTDTGTNRPTKLDDPRSGKDGYPVRDGDPRTDVGDVDSPTAALGQSYALELPVLAVLGGKNANGEPRLDRDYPGYNFNISDQRRAKAFVDDFDRMARDGTLPTFLYIYEPNDHTGCDQAINLPAPTAAQQVGDGDVGLGMVVQHIMSSPVYYNSKTGEGSAIFITYDDAQSTRDHIHPHRTPLMVVSPYAKPGFVAKRHYSTASIVKTEELLLGLPPNNLGDLLATDLRDLFQDSYNRITADDLSFDRVVAYAPSPEGRRIWDLTRQLDTSAPDRDSRRLGALARASMAADRLHADAARANQLNAEEYRERQEELYHVAQAIVRTGAPGDADD
ncbi:MAG TPA: alkaline phosphatase family protein [Tepidisphaeraceae bacterium]